MMNENRFYMHFTFGKNSIFSIEIQWSFIYSSIASYIECWASYIGNYQIEIQYK